MWRYDQRGRIYLADQFVGLGDSGYPPYQNDPNAEQLKGQGPLPKGFYYIGRPYDSPNVGDFALSLEALPGTEVYGRGDFKIHGKRKDGKPGSHGCIETELAIRQRIAASGVNRLEVFCSDLIQ